jgi:hypothetical protein
VDLFSRRAGLAAVRFLFSRNLTGELFELSMRADLFLTLLNLLAAVLAAVYWAARSA